MSHEHDVQVKSGHYTKKRYNHLERFISYFYQINAVASLDDVQTVLEIGPGSKTVSRELQARGYHVTTCDFDASVEPDVVADVRKLPFEKEQFDCVMACQILEHIPFSDFERVIENFANITKKYAVVSFPSRSTGFEILLKFPFIQTLFKKKFFDISVQFPVKFVGFEESGQHYWEIDFWTTKRRTVESILKKHFIIEQSFRPILNKYHQFYVLRKR